MPELILVELSRLNHVAAQRGMGRDVDLNFSTHTAGLRMLTHVVVQFLEGVLVRPRSNIKHQSELGLEVLADRLEEPFMRVNFSIVTLLDTEHKVDAAALEIVTLVIIIVKEVEVPCGDLEAMKEVRGDILRLDILIYNVTHLLHLELRVATHIHKAFLEEDLLI